MSSIRRNLTYANVMASLAVFMVLGGGAYAATVLPKNSVGTAQIKKNAVTSAKVKNGSLTKSDFKAGQLPAGATGATGTTGPQGPKGDKGDTGAAGKDGVDAATNAVVRQQVEPVAANSQGTATVSCEAGERLIGGGGGWVNSITEDLDIPRTDRQLSYNGPASAEVPTADGVSPSGWTVAGNSDNAFGSRLYAYAVCVAP